MFDVPPKTKVRIKAKLVRWMEGGQEKVLGRDVIWEGETTNKFYTAYGARRRLLINHNLKSWHHMGIWQSNVECEIMEG